LQETLNTNPQEHIMAKTDIKTLSREDKEAARKAAVAERERKDAKAAKEKARREEIRLAKEALVKAGLPEDTELTLEQRRRAAASATEKGGLTGQALKTWIIDGKGGKEVIAEAQATEKASGTATARAPRVPRDPVARAFADAAAALAPELRSPFTPKEARLFKEKVTQKRLSDETIRAERTDIEKTVDFPVVALREFAVNGAKDPEIRGLLVSLGEGEKFLWGRKLGLFLLAADAEAAAAK
jgi:hypothetical protein